VTPLYLSLLSSSSKEIEKKGKKDARERSKTYLPSRGGIRLRGKRKGGGLTHYNTHKTKKEGGNQKNSRGGGGRGRLLLEFSLLLEEGER